MSDSHSLLPLIEQIGGFLLAVLIIAVPLCVVLL